MRISSAHTIHWARAILVPRGRAPFGQHQESRPLAKSNTGSPRFTDFPSLCACSESSLTNLIGSGLNLLCLLSHSKMECRWTRPEVAILGADQKERGLWGREWARACPVVYFKRAYRVENSTKYRADDLCVNLMFKYFCWMLGDPSFFGRSLHFLIPS